MSIWDDIPEATEVNLTEIGEDARTELFAEYIDEQKAADLVAKIDGSAADYEANVARVKEILDWVNVAMNGAIKIAKLV